MTDDKKDNFENSDLIIPNGAQSYYITDNGDVSGTYTINNNWVCTSTNYSGYNLVYTITLPSSITWLFNLKLNDSKDFEVTLSDGLDQPKEDKKENIMLQSAVTDGCSCSNCKEFNQFSSPNQQDGSFICYKCRSGW
jgi:hypothetical protein